MAEDGGEHGDVGGRDATDEMHRADAGEGREHPVEVRSEEAGATSDEADAKRLGRVDAFIDLSIVKNERI